MTYTISQADTSGNRQEILALWKENLPTAVDGRYAWLYESGRAKGWVLYAEDGAAVGANGLMMRTIRSPEGILQAGQAIDLNVDKHHRTVGPALRLARVVAYAAAEEGRQLVYAFPNADSEPILRRAGYRPIGTLQRWFKPLRCQRILQKRVHHPLARVAAKPVSSAIDAVLTVKSRETWCCRRPAEIHVRVTGRFDASFDRLWQTASSQFPLIGERTADYLSWRFGQSPSGHFQAFCIDNACQEMLAYVIYACRDGVAHVTDMLFIDVGSLDRLLAEFLRHLRRQKVEAVVLVYLGPRMIGEILKAFGFWQRPSLWNAMVTADWSRLGGDPSLLLDEERWFLTRADIDTDF